VRREAVFVDLAGESSDPFEFLRGVTRRHGDAVRYSGSFGTTYLFNHPDDVKQVLLSPHLLRTSLLKIVIGDSVLAGDGHYWKQQREREQPFFTRLTVPRFAPLIHRRTQALLPRWTEAAQSGRHLDVTKEMTRLTLEIIAEGLFDVDLGARGSRVDELCQSLDVLLGDLGDMMCTQLNAPLTFAASSRQRFKAALAVLDAIIEDIIAERRSAAPDPSNLLSALLTVRDAQTGEHLTTRQLRDEVAALLVGGHETTAVALGWTWSLLAQHPDVERRLHDELDTVLGTKLPTAEDVERLPFTMMVLRESMRLYPPIWLLARRTTSAIELGDVPIDENSLVLVSPYTIHRHPQFWDEPETFNPLRFSSRAARPKHAYIPFGDGRHVCLGRHLALLEAPLILATLAQRYRVHVVPGHPVTPHPALSLRMRHGLMATVTTRTDA
jgi:cytochrome P450